MKVVNTSVVAGVCLLCAGAVIAQQGDEVNAYAVTANQVTLAEPAVLELDPNAINMLAPNLGQLSGGIQPVVRNYMILWCEAKKEGPCQVQWTIHAPVNGQYDVTASIEGKGSRLAVSCNGHQEEATVTQTGWHRLELGYIPLKAGENKVRLDVNAVAVKAGNRTKRFLLSAIELAHPSAKEAIAKEVAATRQKPDWFKDAAYGLMFQWTNRATPPKGPIKPWEEKVNDFNLEQFVQLVDDSGAAYVIWSATWGNQYKQFVDSFQRGESVEVQQLALSKVVENFQSRGTHVVLIAGSVNQQVSRQMEPELRLLMLAFLRQLAERFDNVSLAEEGSELPRATPDQYSDMSHLAEDQRPWYSGAVADYLTGRFGWNAQ